MKFTCDSCGAQYQIADDKLGAKGVKVRCRKCQYLIIVRPKGYEPVAKTTIDPVLYAEHDRPPPSEADQTVNETKSGDLEAVVTGEVSEPLSADFGLSQEFKALGFDEDSGLNPAPKAPNLGMELDVDRLGSRQDSISPFSTDTSGGSLDQLMTDEPSVSSPSEDHTRRLGLSTPPATDDIGESTKVEHQVEKKKASWSLELDSEDTDLREEPTNKGPSPVRPNGSAFGRASPPRGVSGLTSGEVEVGAMLKERNELAEIRSTVDAEMAGFSSELDGWSNGKPAPTSPGSSSDPDTEEDALAALGAAPVRAAAVAATTGESVLGTGIEHEIGDAFDAMFSPAQMASEELMRAGLSAKTEMTPRPPEGMEMASPGGVDKLPTRVFDTEAMANVAAEQERAVAPRAKPVAEWYVAIDDAQVGPLTVDDVTTRWRDGDVGPNSLCWKQGMADWTAIRFTDGLKQLAEKEVQEPKMAARVERRHAEEEEAMVARPPQISMAQEMESPRAMASSPAKLPDAPAWRPSAASLLATLAAEELAEAPAPMRDKRSDIALGPAIPATSNALEKLLESSSTGPIQSPFGQAEKSESAIRPLPRRPDTLSSVPLRDPTLDRPKNSNTPMLVLAILGGCLVIAAAVVVGPKLLADPPPPQQAVVAQAPPAVPPPAQVGGVPGQPAQVGGVPGQPAAGSEALAQGQPPPEVPPPAAPPASEMIAKADTAPAGEVERAPEEKAKKREKTTNKRTERTERTEKAAKEPEKKVEPPPVADPDDPDDLLPKQKKRLKSAEEPETSSLPKQLDDSDILGVLRKNREDVKGCLEKQASSDGNLDGTMTVKAVIERSGKAGRVTIAPDKFKSSVVGKCVSSALQRWRFPEFSGPSIPIDFPVHVRGR